MAGHVHHREGGGTCLRRHCALLFREPHKARDAASSTATAPPIRHALTDEEVEHCVVKAQLDAKRADADFVAAPLANPQIVVENRIFKSVERVCKIYHLEAEREEIIEGLEVELAKEDEDGNGGFASMSWSRPTANDHEASPSNGAGRREGGGGLIPISSEEDFSDLSEDDEEWSLSLYM